MFSALSNERSPVVEGESPECPVRVDLGDALALHQDALGLRDHLARPQCTLEPDRQLVIAQVRLRRR